MSNGFVVPAVTGDKDNPDSFKDVWTAKGCKACGRVHLYPGLWFGDTVSDPCKSVRKPYRPRPLILKQYADSALHRIYRQLVRYEKERLPGMTRMLTPDERERVIKGIEIWFKEARGKDIARRGCQ